MSKMKTVLVVFAALALAGKAYSQMMRRPKGLQTPSTAAKEEGQCGIPGVTAPFVPFDEKDKIKYEDAVERAKKKDAEAFYWLAYYFLNGDGVEKNVESAGKFLQKAVASRNANACYLIGLYHYGYSLKNEHGHILYYDESHRGNNTERLISQKGQDNIYGVLKDAKMFGGISSLQIPDQEIGNQQVHHNPPTITPDIRRRGKSKMNCCFTNDIATGYVFGLFQTAAEGGLTYATNDIARLKFTIAKCRERIIFEEKARAKGTVALNLLADMNGGGLGSPSEDKDGISLKKIIPGVTAPFIPFDIKWQIKYEKAVERAKQNDGEAFYWLAYYFAQGNEVVKDLKSSGHFLQRATELKNVNACYLAGLCLEMSNLCDENGLNALQRNGLLPVSEVNEIHKRLADAGASAIILQLPERISPAFNHSLGSRYWYTNDVATGYIIGLYSAAVKGGLAYATNDIARLKRAVAKCRERIASNEKARVKSVKALNLLTNTTGKVQETISLNKEEPPSQRKEVSGTIELFIPFDQKYKIKFDEAVERAKKKDAEAFYWLAYYFLNGDGVECDRNAAGIFLQKAIEAGNAKACYLVGLYHELYSLLDEHGKRLWWSGLWPENERSTIYRILDKSGMSYGINSLQMPDKSAGNGSQVQGRSFASESWQSSTKRARLDCCCTNDAAVGFVIGLYSTAIRGGLTYVTNDIARLKNTIVNCRKRIAAEEKARAKGAEALDLLADATAKDADATKQKEDEARRLRQLEFEKRMREREYWATWPRTLDDEERTLLDSDFEKKFNCLFLEEQYSRLPRTDENRSDSKHSRTNTWVLGCGKSLIVFHGANYEFFQKIDTNGLIVAWGLSRNRTDLEELKWYEEEKEKRLVPLRSKWAKERGMSLEEAMQKYKVWQEQSRRSLPPQPNRLLNQNNRPGLNAPSPDSRRLSGLEIARARREARLAKERREAEEKPQEAGQMQKVREERERKKREREWAAEERKAQLEQLMQIQEELRRQREEKLREQKQREHNNNK